VTGVRSIVVGTAGHIDHGKSALVRALTGIDPDRLKEEQERGITIDLGFAHLATGSGQQFAFVDVPGHDRFVKNMLAGVGGIDLVMLVVAADESVMPQTREHFHICRLLHVPRGLVVLTKCDAADRDMQEIARLEARDLVAGSFLDGAPIVSVSSRTGEGLAELTAALEALVAIVPVRRTDGPARLPIDRAFSMKGFGTVVTGTLVSGSLRAESELVVLPAGRAARVRGLQVHGRAETQVDAGRRVAVNVGGLDVDEVARGQVLAEPGSFEPSRRIDARLDLLEGTAPLRQGARIRFHSGAAEILGRVTPAGAWARIHLESPAVVTRGDRFIIRSYSPVTTIGGGVVLDPRPPRTAVRSDAGRERLRRLEAGGGDTAATVFLEEAGVTGLPRAALVNRAGLTPREADDLAEHLVGAGTATPAGDRLLSPGVARELAARLVSALEEHHAAQPLSGGMPREEARERLFKRAPSAVFDAVLGTLVAAGRIVARDRLALPGQELALSPEEARVQEALERVFLDARLTPPDLGAAAVAAGAPSAVVDRIVALMLRTRRLVRLDALVFHPGPLEQLKREVRALKGSTARIDVASFKERYGITRKYAIPLLEYLDRERVTRRVGEGRIVL
jgi:selenocysteine-specific elongation factor